MSKSGQKKAEQCLGYSKEATMDVSDTKSDSNFSRFETFHETKAALKILQDSLNCHNNCQNLERTKGQYEKDVFALGVCEHRFCKSCVDSNDESTCPVCSMPYRSTDVNIDKQLSNISALCVSLSNILAGKTDEIVGDPNKQDSSEKKKINTQDKDSKKINTRSLSNLDATTGNNNKKESNHHKTFSVKPPTQGTPEETQAQRGRKRISNRVKESFLESNTPTKALRGRYATPTASSRQNGSNQEPKKKKNKKATESLKMLDEAENVAAKSLMLRDSPNCKADVKGISKQRQINSPSPASKQNINEQRTPGGSRTGSVSLLEKRNAKGESPLQVAALKANFQKVQELLKKGANPNVKDNAGWTPLHEAVNNGNAKIAEILLDYGASVNTPALENDTPLHDAVSNYSLDCVKLLVRKGANVMARNSRGQTSLDLAQTEDMREALLVPDGISVAEEENTFMEEDIFKSGPLYFITSSLSKDQLSSAQKCAKLLDAKLLENNSTEVTHTINGVNADGLCPRTLKYLNAILHGVWIVSSVWIDECLKQSKRVDEETFEVLGCITRGPCKAPQRARLNRLKKLPGLFDGCQFYFHGKFQYPTPSKDQLIQLAKLGGGIILTREPRLHNLDDYPYTVPYHAAPTSSLSDCTIFVIYDDSCPNPPQVKAQRMSYLPASWLMDCIASFDILEKTGYLKH